MIKVGDTIVERLQTQNAGSNISTAMSALTTESGGLIYCGLNQNQVWFGDTVSQEDTLWNFFANTSDYIRCYDEVNQSNFATPSAITILLKHTGGGWSPKFDVEMEILGYAFKNQSNCVGVNVDIDHGSGTGKNMSVVVTPYYKKNGEKNLDGSHTYYVNSSKEFRLNLGVVLNKETNITPEYSFVASFEYTDLYTEEATTKYIPLATNQHILTYTDIYNNVTQRYTNPVIRIYKGDGVSPEAGGMTTMGIRLGSRDYKTLYLYNGNSYHESYARLPYGLQFPIQ